MDFIIRYLNMSLLTFLLARSLTKTSMLRTLNAKPMELSNLSMEKKFDLKMQILILGIKVLGLIIKKKE
ncbi:hypothetical protein BpHYR1_002178 [Brachionus plicatilis]|uniref:Uncharacterized protein n=1 Tax=Brachionus plicatilis TaxID=10195 RepID=A0A3M7QAE4_BRAPC|nr:hypothetical protein BpHYR1_002178 [Brachionus plicatilis]